ncbi:winged helix DNA-binding domain-containing protein, partial [Polychaeton citri CBS 116435]
MKAEHGQLFSKSDNYDEDDISDGSDPCYAQLLYRCLKEAPDRTMTLKDVYDWVAQNSKKASDPSNRGWQNSVRHNLSMNKAFERVSPSTNPGQKKGSLWRL